MCMSALSTEVGGVLTTLLRAAGANDIDEDEVEGLLEGMGGSRGMAAASALAELLSIWLIGTSLIGVVPEMCLRKLLTLALTLRLPDLDDGLDNGCESNICTCLLLGCVCR
jgi:hypothetical protein